MIVFLFAFTCFWVDVSFAQVAPITMSAHDIEIRTNSEECVKHIQNSLHSGISVNTLIESEDRYGIINGKLLFIDLTSLPFPTNSIEEASQRIKQFNGVIDVVTGIRTFRWDEQTRKALENFLAALKSCEVRDMRDYEKQMITNGVNSTMPADMQIARIRENIAELPKYRQLQGDIKKTISVITRMRRRLPTPRSDKDKTELSIMESVALIDSHIMKSEVAANASRWIASNVVYSADELLPFCCEIGSVTNDNPWEAAAALRARCNTIAAVVSMPCSMNATNCQALTSFRNGVLSQIKPEGDDKETPAKPNTPESHRARGEAFYQQMLRQVASELQILIRKFGDIAELSSGTSP